MTGRAGIRGSTAWVIGNGVALLIAGGTLVVAGFAAWTSHGVGSTQSLLGLGDVVSSGIVRHAWVGHALMIPPLCGAAIVVLGGVALATAASSLPAQIAVVAGLIDLVAAATTAVVVGGLGRTPLEHPGLGFVLACVAELAVAAAVAGLLLAAAPRAAYSR